MVSKDHSGYSPWPDPENLTFGTIQTGNFCHTFVESWHPEVHETVGWACQSGSLMGENALPLQPGVKFWQCT